MVKIEPEEKEQDNKLITEYVTASDDIQNTCGIVEAKPKQLGIVTAEEVVEEKDEEDESSVEE